MSAQRGAVLILGLLALAASSGWIPSATGTEPVREFESSEQRQRYWDLLEELRCLVCQNESLAGSQADLAGDLRDEVYTQMVDGGRSDQEIVDSLVRRYGNFVLYRPPWEPSTYLLWLGPFLLLGIGAAVAVVVVRRRRLAGPEEGEPGAAERARASALLRDESGENDQP